jgi:nucleotide-binding universal stress UspA family protein
VQEAGFELRPRPRLGDTKTAIWQEKVGVPDKVMAITGPVSDLIVVTRPAAKGYVARMFMLAALLHSGRPVLVLPPGSSKVPGKRIAIAWNQSPEVARVVSACMPMLQQAEQVTIISAGAENRVGPKASQLQNYLKQYGVSAKVKVTRGRHEEKELTGIYTETKSDLLLMGAYSRARFRELVFGGMTEYMLSSSKIPVIMQHS